MAREALHTHRRLLLPLSLVLLVAGAGLWLLAGFLTPAAPPALPAPRPSPPWNPFPTRVASPTPASAVTPYLQRLRYGLLRRDRAMAEAAWDAALRAAPEGTAERGVVLREGARLALAWNELEAAEARIWPALRALPQDAETWGLLGLILARRGDAAAAEQALAIAEGLDPALAPGLFRDRWIAARRAGGRSTMMSLAQTYGERHPEDGMALYYRTATLVEFGDADLAIAQLVDQLTAEPQAPAVLWYTLGEAYLATGAYSETLVALDVAGFRHAMGDSSLLLASDDPLRDLGLLRAWAYLGLNTPGRCTEAEPLLRRWGAPEDVISRAQRCQTPTPTWTPWMVSQQKTPTPTPNP